jgi:serine/threonine protein kinase
VLDIGSQFAGYRIDGVLGRGSMGVVYRAWEQNLNRPVALKVIAEHIAADTAFRDRFASEARLAATVDHPGIVAIYAAGEHDGIPFLAMRLVDGLPLSEVLESRGRFAPPDAAQLLQPIAGALDAAGRKGVLHRDVKLANILVPADGTSAVLIDFGIGKAADATRATQTGGWLGTVDYLAPERINGRAADDRSDQYSLACVLFELVTGKPPFLRDEPIKTLFAHANDPIPAAETLSPASDTGINTVFARCLAKDPEERFVDCKSMLEAFLAAARGEQSPARTGTVVGNAGGVAGPSGTVIAGRVPRPHDSPKPDSGRSVTPERPLSRSCSKFLIVSGVVGAVLLLAILVIAATRGGGGEEPANSMLNAAVTVTETSASVAPPPALEEQAIGSVEGVDLTQLAILPGSPYRCVTPTQKDHGNTISFVAHFANGITNEFRSDSGNDRFVLCGGSTSQDRPGYASGTLGFQNPNDMTRVVSVSGLFGRDYDAGVNRGGTVAITVAYDGAPVCNFATNGAGDARRFVCKGFPASSDLSGVTISLEVEYDAQYSEFAGIGNLVAKAEVPY